MNSQISDVSRVYRSKDQAKQWYDKISRFYDCFAGVFEKKYKDRGLDRLSINRGETILEIGFGTGYCLIKIAELVGEKGRVFGIDISSGMREVSRQRLEKAGLLDRAELYGGDAVQLPFKDNKFDAVFISFTLELFDTPEMPEVLSEINRVLKPKGRIGVVSMSKDDDKSLLLRVYEWIHTKFPQYVDCRPISVEELIKDAGFGIVHKERVKVVGLPVTIVVGAKVSSTTNFSQS